ncbi:MAG: tetratricopeptide repeat protein [Chlorobiaceae bacterium]|nr:tetratricopeptide repeat protein [Chlorobiaceae bacterium]
MKNAAQAQAEFEQAFACHRQGELAQAATLYEKVLSVAPNHVDALHLAGLIAAQTNNPHKAVDLIGKAIAIQPGNAAFHGNLGIVLNGLNEFESAVASFDKAVTIKPDFPEAWYNRGIALQGLNMLNAAVESFDKAITIKSDFAEAHFDRANALHELNRFDEALSGFDNAIAIKSGFAEAHCNRGNALLKLNRVNEALSSYDTAISLRSGYHIALYNRGNALRDIRKFDDAVESYDQAIAIKADFAEAWSNRGSVLKMLKKLEAALESFDQAISIRPDYHEAHTNRGNTLQELKQIDASIASFDKAICLKPDYADAYLHKSMSLLMGGNFRQGWELYEWRWKKEKFTSPGRNFTRPLWLGDQSMAGKTILLHSEQGFGDTIQFSRYARLFADLGARVILEVDLPLIGLFKELPGVSELVVKGAALPDFDCHCPLLSLPLAFRTEPDTIPYPHHYLKSDPDKVARWKNRLGDKAGPRIGLVWSGNATHMNDSSRSIPLSALIRILPPGFSYVSLQKEVRQSDKPTLESNVNILHFGDEMNDFTDTAALCDLMDLVISVDTGVAHLNGALGNPTWVLLPFSPDWRWMLDRDDSPWYWSVRLFRQQEQNDWGNAFERLKSALLTVYGKHPT